MLTSLHLHEKQGGLYQSKVNSSLACIRGQVTKHTTVKWPIVGCGFCDIQNNQGRGKGYQRKPNAEAYNSYLDLDYSGYHRNQSS